MIAVLRPVVAFVRLGRPLFLVGGFLMYALGAGVAVATGAPLDGAAYLGGQLAVTAFQLMTHYANDYFDLDADQANTTPTRWSGGSRVLPGGELPREAALLGAVFLAGAGGGLTLALALAGAPARVVAALCAAGLLAWRYSAPPRPLHSTGAGELGTAVVVTGLVPFVGFHLQARDLAGVGTLLAALVPPALLQFAMLLAIEFPDAAGDAAVGKRTLVVRLGGARAARLLAAATAAPFLALPLLALALPRPVVLAVAAVCPLALWRVARLRAGDWARPERWESLAFWAVALLMITGAAELLGFAQLARERGWSW